MSLIWVLIDYLLGLQPATYLHTTSIVRLYRPKVCLNKYGYLIITQLWILEWLETPQSIGEPLAYLLGFIHL